MAPLICSSSKYASTCTSCPIVPLIYMHISRSASPYFTVKEDLFQAKSPTALRSCLFSTTWRSRDIGEASSYDGHQLLRSGCRMCSYILTTNYQRDFSPRKCPHRLKPPKVSTRQCRTCDCRPTHLVRTTRTPSLCKKSSRRPISFIWRYGLLLNAREVHLDANESLTNLWTLARPLVLRFCA